MNKIYFSKKRKLLLRLCSAAWLFFLSLFALKTNAQCPQGNVALFTQAQVEQFVIDYPNCTEIDGNLQIGTNNSAPLSNITDLSPLQNITLVQGSMSVQFNGVLQHIDALNSITEIGGALIIYYNSQLLNLDGLTNVNSIGSFFSIDGNVVLEDISGITNISESTIPELYIQNNPALQVCNLANVCEYLQTNKPRNISGNAGDCITEQAVIDKCNECPLGDVDFFTQAEINQFIIDYPNCTEIAGYLEVFGGINSITSLNGLTNITKVQGYVKFGETELQSLNGFNITEIGAGLSLESNEFLTNIDALTSLSVCNGPIGVIGSMITNLNALSNLTAIDGDIVIWMNPALTDISGLENIDPATISDVEGFGLYIVDNSLLQVCDLSNFCGYLANDENTHPRTIFGNAGDCITEQAVKNACVMSLDEINAASLKAYPNPVNDVLVITYTKNITSVSVINVFGQEVISKTINATNTQVDMSMLAAGNYFIKVSFDGMIKTMKVVKK